MARRRRPDCQLQQGFDGFARRTGRSGSYERTIRRAQTASCSSIADPPACGSAECGRTGWLGANAEMCRSGGTYPCSVELLQSRKLADVCYDIRGPVLEEAKRLEEEGRRIIKLNIGNPAPFGFEAPDEILVDVIRNLPHAQGYSDSQGLLSARTAIVQHYQAARHRHGRRRRHLARQRGQRTDHHQPAGDARQRRRGADPRSGLPAVDGVDLARRREAGALPLRRVGRLAARSRRSARQGHPPHQGDRGDQPEQPDRRGVLRGGARRESPTSPASTVWSCWPTRSTTRSSTTTPSTCRSPAVAPDVFTLTFNGLSKAYRRGRVPGRLDDGHRPEAGTPPATSRASPSWPTCDCAPTCRPSTPCRSRSAAGRASTSWCCRAGGCTNSATPRSTPSTRSPA